MIRSILIGVLIIALVGTSYFGYKSYQDKNNMMTHIENNYQRAFHNLVYHMDVLHDQMGTSFVMNSGERLSPQFVDIWRTTSVAQSDVSQLPLGLLPFQHTARFLAELHQFTYDTAVRNLDDDPLTPDELAAFEKYYEQAGIIKDELRNAQHMTLNNQVRWTDIELALLDGQMDSDNEVLDGFRSIEDGTSTFSDDFTDNPFTNNQTAEKLYSTVKGERYDESSVVEKAVKMFDLPSDDVVVTDSLPGADIANYNVSYRDDEREIFMDMTAEGAYPVTFIIHRDIAEPKKSIHDGSIAARDYLNEVGYENMEMIESKQYDNIGVYTFAYVENDVYVLPDNIGIKVALDTGEIIGMHAREYLKNHHERQIKQARISKEEAEKNIHEKIAIQDSKLVLWMHNNEETLAYMFYGVVNDDTYRIFIDAENGSEQKVEKLTDAEMTYQQM